MPWLIAGLLLAWRFHSSRIFFALLVVFLAQASNLLLLFLITSDDVAAGGPGSTALAAVGLLLPLNFVLLSLHREEDSPSRASRLPRLLLFVQSVIVGVLCRPEPLAAAQRRFASCLRAGAVAFRHTAGIRRSRGRFADTLSAVPQARRERTPMGAGSFAFWRFILEEWDEFPPRISPLQRSFWRAPS